MRQVLNIKRDDFIDVDDIAKLKQMYDKLFNTDVVITLNDDEFIQTPDRSAEIKCQMAATIYAGFADQEGVIEEHPDVACEVAEQIYNYFNGGKDE